MTNEMFDLMAKANRHAFEAVRELGEIQMKAMDQLTQQQVALFSEGVEKATAYAKQLTEAKDYKAAMTVQSEIAQDYAQSAVAQTRKTLEVVTEARDALNGMVQRGVEQAVAEVAKAGPRKAA